MIGLTHYRYYVILQHPTTDPSMNVIEAWKSGYTGEGTTIAIVDDGVDINHPDLKENIVSVQWYLNIHSDNKYISKKRLFTCVFKIRVERVN